jgi:hypothetical protein
VTVESVRLRLLLVAPLRLVLSIVFLAAARAAGGAAGPTLLAFAAGAFAMAFLVPNDPRARFRGAPGAPAALPAGASVAPAWLHALHAALPSTAGVSALAAVALFFQPTLTALLAGILAGLGLAAAFRAYAIDGRLYVNPKGGELFRGDQPFAFFRRPMR